MNSILDRGTKERKTKYGVDPLLYGRWSPRAMSGENIPKEALYCIFEAGGWASSSYNEQPWRLIYAEKGSQHFEKLFNLLMDANKTWAKDAACLCVLYSSKVSTRNGKPFPTHTISCGSAWQNISLQATKMGYVAHGMAGFDYKAATKELSISAVPRL